MTAIRVNSAFQFRGYAADYSTDFNEISAPGIYYLNGTTMDNGPSNYTWAYLIVVQQDSSTVLSQMVLKPMGGILWMRERSGSPTTWKSWKYPYSDCNGGDFQNGNFNNATSPGYYRVVTWSANGPSTDVKWGVLHVARSGNYCTQVYYPNYGSVAMWKRSTSDLTNWTSWMSVT